MKWIKNLFTKNQRRTSKDKNTEKHEGWINIYRDFDGMLYCGNVFATEEDAKCNTKIAIATIKIEWEE